ncbi:Hypothetical predicted protein [Octopus vulgaris]|uniref:Uncharacterized protein n=1 Tax=Octopus vulgaris TaxID=6645 RepID=A0AA36F5W0_OCTVU|nr:Hypothetical predicted protein [Octopus vulgaris]
MESQLNQPVVTGWGALSSESDIGPVFSDRTVNGESYLEMLRDVVVPQLRTKANFDELFSQQGEAPPHFALTPFNNEVWRCGTCFSLIKQTGLGRDIVLFKVTHNTMDKVLNCGQYSSTA